MVASIPVQGPLPVSAEAILDGLQCYVAVLSTEGAILFVNAAVLKKSADRAENILGKPFATARWWTHIPGVSAQIEVAVQQARAGRTSKLDIEAQFAPAQRSIVEFEMRPEKDASGAVVAIVVEGRDISEQRAIERKLRETQFRWRTIADFTVDWEFWLHPNGYFLYVSPSCQRVSGYTPDEFMQGKVTLAGIADPQDKKKVLDLLTQAFSGSTDHHHTWRVVRRDGGIRWVSMSWQSVHDEDGNSMGVRGSIRDVTELMKAQEELQRSVEAYRTLARHFPRGMVALLDRELRLVVCDGPAFGALPMDPETLLGKRLFDVLDRDMRARLEPLITTATNGTEVADIVQFGNSAWLVHLTPIRDPQDRIAHIIASAVESQDAWTGSAENPTEPGHTT